MAEKKPSLNSVLSAINVFVNYLILSQLALLSEISYHSHLCLLGGGNETSWWASPVSVTIPCSILTECKASE